MSKTEKLREAMASASNKALDTALPMRRMARLAVLNAIQRSPVGEASKKARTDPSVAATNAYVNRRTEGDLSEFKRLNRNAVKRKLGMEEEAAPEADWSEYGEMEPIDGESRKIDGFKKGGKVSSKASKRADGIAQRGKTRGRVI